MDSNKDEAIRCIAIAKEAIASGNKNCALKFIGIARRLDHNLPVDDLLDVCENLDLVSIDHSDKTSVDSATNETVSAKFVRVQLGIVIIRKRTRN